MNLYNEGVNLEGILTSDLPIEAKVNVLFDVLKNVLDEGAIRARTVRFKLQKYVNSTDINERIYALNVIASDGNGAKGNKRGLQILQKQEQNQHGKHRAQQQAVQNGLYDDVDVVTLVHQGHELQPGILRLQLPEALGNVVGGLGGGVGALLFKAQHDAVLAVELGVGLVAVVGYDHNGHIL